MPTKHSRRYLYLMKEPCDVFVKSLLWIVVFQLGFLVYYITDQIWAVGVGTFAGIPLWLLAERSVGYFKIGVTKDLKARLTAVNNGNARKIYYVHVKELNEAGVVEKKIHHKYTKKRRDGEWFKLWFWQVWWLKIRYF